MNKLVLYIVLFISNFYIAILNAQNLVPNPSFEEIVQCPEMPDPGQIHLAKPWFQPTPWFWDSTDFETSSSSDLFHECAPQGESGVPLSWAGYQFARTGKGYAGIGFWQSSTSRERIEVELNDSLLKDSTYCVSMYVVNKTTNTIGTATSNLHFLFTKDSLIQNFGYYTTPSVENPITNFISDTNNWTEINVEYVAKGGEKFLTIGSFYSNQNSTVLDSNSYTAYYFIDDVWVARLGSKNCPCKGEEVDKTIVFPNTFTPNNDGSNDFWSIDFKNASDYVLILNRWGNKVTELNKNSPKWDGNCKGKPCTEGVYFYKAYINGEPKHGFIHLFR